MKSPTVSILMCEYNTPPEQFETCVRSILAQTFQDFELIIVNDKSETNISEILKKMDDSRIKIINNSKNLGLAESLNQGMKKCNSDIIIRMDTDDIMVKNRVEKQLGFYRSHKQYSFIGGCYYIFDGSKSRKASIKTGEIIKNDFLYNTPFAHPTLLINKKDLLSTGGYPNYRRNQDYAMEMNMYANGYRGFNMPDTLIYYRQDKNGYRKKNYASRIMEYNIRKKYFKKLGLPLLRVIYEIKPLLVGLLPKCVLKRVQKR